MKNEFDFIERCLNVMFACFVLLVILIALLLNKTYRDNRIKNNCFDTHGHIEMFEDGRVECKYPLNIP